MYRISLYYWIFSVHCVNCPCFCSLLLERDQVVRGQKYPKEPHVRLKSLRLPNAEAVWVERAILLEGYHWVAVLSQRSAAG